VPTYLSEQCVAALQYRLFPASELPAVVSVVVISRGVVGLAGAPLGGALYENGGWSLPYVFVGGWNLATLALMALVVGVGRGGRSVMPPPRVEPLMRVLRMPGVLASCVSYFSAFACLAVLEVIWQPWLGTAPYSYSPTKIGAMSIATMLAFVIAALIGPPIARKMGSVPILWLAHAIAIIALLLIGAPPLAFPDMGTSAGDVVAINALLGLGLGLVCTLVPPLLQQLLLDGGMDQSAASIPLGALTVFFPTLGVALGPLLISPVVAEAGVDVASVVLACIQGVALLLSLRLLSFVGLRAGD